VVGVRGNAVLIGLALISLVVIIASWPKKPGGRR
jgi:hypothetical protein